MYGRDNSPCRVCGARQDPCLCSYSNKELVKELKRRDLIVKVTKMVEVDVLEDDN